MGITRTRAITYTPRGKVTSSQTESKESILIAISLTPADNKNKLKLICTSSQMGMKNLSSIRMRSWFAKISCEQLLNLVCLLSV